MIGDYISIVRDALQYCPVQFVIHWLLQETYVDLLEQIREQVNRMLAAMSPFVYLDLTHFQKGAVLK